MVPEEIDFDTALKLLTLPRNLGDHPEKTVTTVTESPIKKTCRQKAELAERSAKAQHRAN